MWHDWFEKRRKPLTVVDTRVFTDTNSQSSLPEDERQAILGVREYGAPSLTNGHCQLPVIFGHHSQWTHIFRYESGKWKLHDIYFEKLPVGELHIYLSEWPLRNAAMEAALNSQHTAFERISKEFSWVSRKMRSQKIWDKWLTEMRLLNVSQCPADFQRAFEGFLDAGGRTSAAVRDYRTITHFTRKLIPGVKTGDIRTAQDVERFRSAYTMDKAHHTCLAWLENTS